MRLRNMVQTKNNYLIQLNQAKAHFLTYDQEQLIRKFQLQHDAQYFYIKFLCKLYRLSRSTGDLERLENGHWQDANTFGEVMVLLDLLCDSRVDRCLAKQWQSMQSFGLNFHRGLLESRDPFADRIDRAPEAFRKACLAFSATPLSGCDIGYSIELFDGLSVAIQFWHGDDDFFPRVCWLWDANALQYLKYETMHFAIGFIREQLLKQMRDK